MGEGAAAKGVPARFLDPEAPAPAPAVKEGDGGKGQEKAGGGSGAEAAGKENQGGGQSEVKENAPKQVGTGQAAQSGGTAPVPAPS